MKVGPVTRVSEESRDTNARTSTGSEEKTYTYTIITTDSNKQLKFLHDRMPVILEPGSDDLKRWLDPSRHEWSRELQSLLKPYDGALEVYPVSKEVGKVGNNSPSFVIPVNSKENKSNIANFFSNASSRSVKVKGGSPKKAQPSPSKQDSTPSQHESPSEKESERGDSPEKSSSSLKRKASASEAKDAPSPKKSAQETSGKISSTQNVSRGPQKISKPGAQKITKFFNSA